VDYVFHRIRRNFCRITSLDGFCVPFPISIGLYTSARLRLIAFGHAHHLPSHRVAVRALQVNFISCVVSSPSFLMETCISSMMHGSSYAYILPGIAAIRVHAALGEA
jgi:hypothetical protein